MSTTIADLAPKCGDGARRMSDAVTLAAIAGGAGCWLAIKLQDGSSDNVLYPSRSEAIRHQTSSEYCTYVLVPPDGMQIRQADAVLDFWRQCYDAGFRAVDPRDDIPSMPLTAPDARRQIRLLKGR